MVYEKIKNIIAKNLAVPNETITLNSNLLEDLGADSLDLVEIAMDIEDTFDISISDELYESIATVEDIVAIVKKVTN